MCFVCGDNDKSVWKWIEVGEVVFGGISENAWMLRALEVTHRIFGRENL